MKEIEVTVTKYQTEDGRVFGNKESATIHEGLLNGSIKVCPRCDGSGEVDIYGDGRIFNECSQCKGAGRLYKQTIWGSKNESK